MSFVRIIGLSVCVAARLVWCIEGCNSYSMQPAQEPVPEDKKHLTIALLQMDAIGTNQIANIKKATRFCKQAAKEGADIAVMPEMWNIGYRGFFENDEKIKTEWQAQAVARDSEYVEHFRKLARECDMAIAVTYLEEYPGAPRNSVTLIDRHGTDVFTYAKMHTCDFAAFEAATTPGEDVYVATLDTHAGPVKVGAMICFDREFPETARLLMLKGTEVVLVPNACHLDDIRLAQFCTRAVENTMVMAMANYPDPMCGGRSIAYMVDGKLLVRAGGCEEIVYAHVSLPDVRFYRKNGLWGNAFRRPHRYNALTEQHDIPAFVRSNAFGELFCPQKR